MKKVYIVLDLTGGVLQDQKVFQDPVPAQKLFIKWINRAYGKRFRYNQVEEAQDFNSFACGNQDEDIRYIEEKVYGNPTR